MPLHTTQDPHKRMKHITDGEAQRVHYERAKEYFTEQWHIDSLNLAFPQWADHTAKPPTPFPDINDIWPGIYEQLKTEFLGLVKPHGDKDEIDQYQNNSA